MERKIGETFEFKGKKLQVHESASEKCGGCFFDGKCFHSRKVAGDCDSDNRTDEKNVIFVEVQEQPQEQAEQPQKLNLCEVLKYCPQGETFWSPMFDNVTLVDIDQEAKNIKVLTKGQYLWNINNDGTITIDGDTSPEIMLYPSREQRDWAKVKYEKKKLPKTWEEFCKNYPLKKEEAFFDMDSEMNICGIDKDRDKGSDKCVLPSREAAEAHLALMQLHQLRDAWREGWLPDWTDEKQHKYVILMCRGEYEIKLGNYVNRFLSFQDEKRADEFKDYFIDLIRKAGDLI